MGVTGSFHTTTFHALALRVLSLLVTSDSVVVNGWVFVEGTCPVSQTADQRGRGAP